MAYNVFSAQYNALRNLEIVMAIGSKWAGKARPDCDICQRQIQHSFVDGVTSNGRWGIMCPTCRISEGRMALGVGLGQKYDRVGDAYVRTV